MSILEKAVKLSLAWSSFSKEEPLAWRKSLVPGVMVRLNGTVEEASDKQKMDGGYIMATEDCAGVDLSDGEDNGETVEQVIGVDNGDDVD